jgi:hypothetical protein
MVRDTCLRRYDGVAGRGAIIDVCFSCGARSKAVKRAAQFPLAPTSAGASCLCRKASLGCAVKVIYYFEWIAVLNVAANL